MPREWTAPKLVAVDDDQQFQALLLDLKDSEQRQGFLVKQLYRQAFTLGLLTGALCSLVAFIIWELWK